MAGKKKGEIHRLEDLLVEEVSIVDRPANQRRFLTVKNEDGMEPKGREIQVDDGGNLVTSPEAPAPDSTPATTPAPEVPTDFSVAKSFGQFGEAIEKSLTIPGDMRADLFRNLGEVLNRVHSVMGAADSARVDRDGTGGSTLLPVLAAELAEVSKILTEVAGKVNGATKTKKEDKPEPPAASGTDAQLAALVESLETAVEKRGAKMSKTRLQQFKTAMATLAKLLAELEGAGGGPPVPGDDGAQKGKGKGDVAKAADVPSPVSKALESLTATVERLTGVVQKQGKELRTLRTARPSSNAIPVEKGRQGDQQVGEVSWPLDMNDEKNRQTVDKATSFLDS